MFTGIVQGKAHIKAIKNFGDLKRFEVQFPPNTLQNLQRGASIALNGTCLTATDFDVDKATVEFDIMNQTLKLTNLGTLAQGQSVNFERAAKIGDEIGGHLMSGHIHQTIKLCKVAQDGNVYILSFEHPKELSRYIFDKGFIGLNGCSLTIADVDKLGFSVHLIPETLEITTFRDLKTGDLINLEIDPQTQATVDTVERYLSLKDSAQ